MAAKFFTGLPLDGPDPECVKGHGEALLAARDGESPRPGLDHSHLGSLPARTAPTGARSGPVLLTLGRRPRDCDPDPLAGLTG